MIRLSKSALEKFRSCPRCFWLEKVKSLKQPEGIRSGLPMGMDRVLKEHYDRHRSLNKLPPELQKQLPAYFGLYGGTKISMKDLRNWRKGLSVLVKGAGLEVELSTALDDLLESPEHGRFAMLDYKTKAKATDEAATQLYYGVQADCYDLALNANAYKTEGVAYFAYYYPVTVKPEMAVKWADGMTTLDMSWACQVIAIKADPERAKDLVLRAATCLEGKEPDPSTDCGFCGFVTARIAGSDTAAKVGF